MVSRVEIMTGLGWRNINNLTGPGETFQQPFQLYREGEQTWLQVGNSYNPFLLSDCFYIIFL